MMYTFQRAGDLRSCETRPASRGPGYELVITEGRFARVEHFQDARSVENRQYELRHAWLMHGWRTTDHASDVDERD
jgi:hypothetical protein